MKRLNFPKKGQAAMEYMQTYGWAVLVVLIVGVVLWQLGIFSVNPEANVATGFSKIKVLEPSIRYDGFYKQSVSDGATFSDTLNFTIANVAGNHIHISSFGVGGDCNKSLKRLGESCSMGEMELSKTILAPDETATVQHICCKVLYPGDFFWLNLSIEYWQRVGERKVNHTERGAIQGYVEICDPNKYGPEACTKS